MADNAVVAVSAGTHTIGLQWKNLSDLTPTPDHGISYIYPNNAAGYGASMIVMEIGS